MGLFDETAKFTAGQDPVDTSTSGLGSLAAKAVQKAVDDEVLNTNTVNTPLSDLKSIIVRDPSMVDPSFDISGVRTTTPTRSELLAAVPEFSGFEYDPTKESYFSDLYALYGGGVPTVDVAQDTAQIPGAIDTLVDVGGGGGSAMDQPAGDSILDTTPTNTQFEQNLLNQGIGVQRAVGDPVVAPGEMPLTQDDFDAFNKIAVTPNLNDIDLGNPLNDPRVVPEEFGLVGTPSYVDPIMDPNLMAIRQQQTLEAQDLDEQGNLLQSGIDKIRNVIPNFDPLVAGTKLAFNTLIGKPVTLVFDLLSAISPEDPADTLNRNIVNELKAEKDYGFNIQSGNLNQDPFGRNPVSAFCNYEQTLLEDSTSTGTTKMALAKKEFAQDYFDKKASKTAPQEDIGSVSEDISLGGENIVDEFKPSDIKPTDPSLEIPDRGRGDGGGGQDTGPVSTAGQAGPPSQRGGGGGSSGGGGKIVCTMMNESYGFGSFRNKIWIKYAKDNLSPEHQKGYHKIFLQLVKLSKKNIILKKILEHIAVHRTIDIRQESRGKVHLLGRIYRKILEPICYWVGKYD